VVLFHSAVASSAPRCSPSCSRNLSVYRTANQFADLSSLSGEIRFYISSVFHYNPSPFFSHVPVFFGFESNAFPFSPLLRSLEAFSEGIFIIFFLRHHEFSPIDSSWSDGLFERYRSLSPFFTQIGILGHFALRSILEIVFRLLRFSYRSCLSSLHFGPVSMYRQGRFFCRYRFPLCWQKFASFVTVGFLWLVSVCLGLTCGSPYSSRYPAVGRPLLVGINLFLFSLHRVALPPENSDLSHVAFLPTHDPPESTRPF